MHLITVLPIHEAKTGRNMRSRQTHSYIQQFSTSTKDVKDLPIDITTN